MSERIKTSTRLALVGATVAASAALLGAGTAQAAPANQAALPCGFTHWYWGTATLVQGYNHCGSTTVRIHVDVKGSGAANDYNLCVGPGPTALSFSADIQNAYYIGGAGCPKGQRS